MAADGRVTTRRAPRRAAPRREVAEPSVAAFDVDGVATFAVEAPGPTIAGLRFRVGQSDETLPTRGVSHLVEHLALHSVGQDHGANNGAVGMTETTFYVRGEPEEVGTFLALLSAGLTDLPVERLELEARILQTEAAGKGPSAYAALLAYRFGPQGHGLPVYDELGLSTLDGDDVQAWSDARFTAGNAALWIAGTLPDELVLYLPEGPLRPAPPPAGLEQALPGWFVDRPGVAAFDALVPRSDAVVVAHAIVRQRIEDRLRHRDATTYSVVGEVEPWTADVLHLFLAADTLPEHASAVANGIVAAVGELGVTGPDRSELDRMAREAADAWHGPHVPLRLVDNMALNHLQQRPTRPTGEFLADLAAVSAEDVRRAALDIFDSLLMLVPPGGGISDRRLAPIASWSDDRISGPELRRTRWFDDVTAANRLVVTREGVTYRADDERAITVRFSAMRAVQRWQDGARTLTGADGFRVFVHPDEWEGGARAVETIDRATPDRIVVPMPKPAGSRVLAEVERRGPAPPPAPPPPAAGGRRRLRRA